MGTKVCRICGKTLPLTEFTKVPRGKSGVSCTCRNCTNEKRKAERKSCGKSELKDTKGIPKGVVSGSMFKAEIDSETFLGMTYEVKDKYILMKSTNPNAKGNIKVSFAYVDILVKELQDIKNTYFGIRI